MWFGWVAPTPQLGPPTPYSIRQLHLDAVEDVGVTHDSDDLLAIKNDRAVEKPVTVLERQARGDHEYRLGHDLQGLDVVRILSRIHYLVRHVLAGHDATVIFMGPSASEQAVYPSPTHHPDGMPHSPATGNQHWVLGHDIPDRGQSDILQRLLRRFTVSLLSAHRYLSRPSLTTPWGPVEYCYLLAGRLTSSLRRNAGKTGKT